MQSFKKFLNPLYRDIHDIANFNDLKDLTPLEQEEYPLLQKVTEIKKNEIAFLLPTLEKLEKELEEQILRIESESSADERADAKGIYNQILRQIELLVERINRELIALDSPYFGKIILTPYKSKNGKDLTLYIGKFAVVDKETHIPLVADWRAPISNIYYENTGPTNNVSYSTPVGKRGGDLKQKRQFQISRARIKGIYDAKSGNIAADEFLLSQLTERIGKKLQDIVSTIQQQQNQIIRDEIQQPSLIQGVAGSGKTTILLHRLAYLFYTYKDDIHPENSLIIAPNQMFIDYVSDVLPNLGVEKVDTESYLFWAKEVLGWGDNFSISTLPEDLKQKEFKGSTGFLTILDKYFEIFEKELLENIPYSRRDIIEDRYYSLKKDFPDINMTERLELATEYAFAQKQFKQKDMSGRIKERGNDFEYRKSIYTYFKRKCNVYSLYKNLFKSDLLSKDTSKYSLEALKQVNSTMYYRMEDLAPMVYLFFKLEGTKLHKKDFIMVDEAQDMSFVQLATLLQISKNGNITLAGDLAQSIVPPFYIQDWNDVIKLIKNITGKDTLFYNLHRCYRTTVEIVEFSNRILRSKFPTTYKLPEAVLRHGDDVRIIEYDRDISKLDRNKLKELASLFRDEFNKGAVSCALLCRNRSHALMLYSIFKEYEDFIGREVISFQENDYSSGLLVLPVEFAKGLEFDSVVLADFNSNFYKNTELDYRLFYVGVTRALHRLYVIKGKDTSLF